MPVHDPHFMRLPWARLGGTLQWSLVLLFAPLAGALVVGAVWSAAAARAAARRRVATGA